MESDEAHQMLMLKEEVAKLLRREHEHLHAIEQFEAEAKGDEWKCTIVEFQCEQQWEQFKRAWLDHAPQVASMDHD